MNEKGWRSGWKERENIDIYKYGLFGIKQIAMLLLFIVQIRLIDKICII